MPVFEMDGKPVEFEPGEKVLSAAMRAGIKIPHYCYHPGMSVVATCRMCMVDVIDMGNGRPAPKLQTSCSMDAVEGMKVETKNEKVQEARELVMEYLLINHPLDCPICDQSGECVLQDYSFEYGSGKSEMEYSKRVYGWRDIGTFVALERNRCIQCTRCDRFTREITGTNEFGMFNRGHELTVDTYSDRPMINQFQGNMADICPVGALTEKEFRFKRRAWKLKKTPSICVGCSTGCNVTIEYDRNEVFRLKPRDNPEVNKWWMCDLGRLTYKTLNQRENRLGNPLGKTGDGLQEISWEEAFNAISGKIKELQPSSTEVLGLVDTHASNEELYLFKKLLKQGFGSDLLCFPEPDWEQPVSDFFIDSLITSDKTPNRAGARLLGLKGEKSVDAVLPKLTSGVKVLLVLGQPFDVESLQVQAASIPLVVNISAWNSGWTQTADVSLPGRLHAEKEVTYTNKAGRVQRVQTAIRAHHKTRPDWMILCGLMEMLDVENQVDSTESIFLEMADAEQGFKELQWEELSSDGLNVPQTLQDPGRTEVSELSKTA
ncbi:MAG: molybdopterin-dependent oxidoreductase [SAR324 cluster bacterium]|jgi:NADH-quinone oxidoreductase subunit G|nr:molybdopterin-dependent oxidoreductase [SAR324 cluster bacterium]